MLEKLKEQPYEVRQKVGFIIAATVTIILAVLWFVIYVSFLSKPIEGPFISDVAKEDFSEMMGNVKEQISEARDVRKKVFSREGEDL